MKRAFAAMTAAVALLVMAPAPAQAASNIVTVIISPHPDDETLRLSAYANLAASRGDAVYLVAVTDGGASSAMERAGFSTPAEMMAYRRSEQAAAWSHLTQGRGKPIIRWGIADGAVTTESVRSRMSQLHRDVQEAGKVVEYYVAASATDEHEDHRATASGAKLGLHSSIVYRNSKDAGALVGTKYMPVSHAAAHSAYLDYEGFGWVSVPTSFQKLEASGHASRIVGYGS